MLTGTSKASPPSQPSGGSGHPHRLVTVALCLLTLMSTGTALAFEATPTPDQSAAQTTSDTPAEKPANTSPTAIPEGASEVAVAEVAATSDDVTDPQQHLDIFEERLRVVGSADRAREIPGSAHFIGTEELDRFRNTDIHRVLSSVPGVYYQEEDGFGLRPNIGLRGSGVERSQKITLLEDGVLIAPAPYAAPAAYYFPTVGRMEAVEIRKGSAAISQGPRTLGGALNLVSRSVPTSFSSRVEVAAGSHDTRRIHAFAGDRFGNLSVLAEGFLMETDGFKNLDGGGPTGFDLEDYMLKVRWDAPRHHRRFQTLELKLGKTTQFGSETYLGLSEGDFNTTPYRRYAASALDTIDADHEQIQLSHFLDLGAGRNLTTVVYDNEFFRDWFKNESVASVSNRAILADPGTYGRELAILQGDIDSDPGDLALRHNRRDYYARGVQTIFGLDRSSGSVGGVPVRHQVEIGVRYHEDSEDRFQEEDRFQMVGGSLVLTEIGTPGSQSNRISEAEALAIFVKDEITLGRWRVVPGMRYETIELTRFDYSTADPDRSQGPTRVRRTDIDTVIPGLGVDFDLDGRWSFFAGVHRGFAPPGPGSNADTEPEESVNYEVGARFGDAINVELVGFYNDYQNLLGAETVSGGGTSVGDLFNGGEVEMRGLELSARGDAAGATDSVRWPWAVAYTWTDAEFRSSFTTSFSDWAPRVNAGDELPYLPEHVLSASAGVSANGWSAGLQASWMSAQRTSPGVGPIPSGEGTDDRWLLELSTRVQLLDQLQLFANVRNLLDETYIVSRRPYGLRPGLPRTLSVGLRASF